MVNELSQKYKPLFVCTVACLPENACKFSDWCDNNTSGRKPALDQPCPDDTGHTGSSLTQSRGSTESIRKVQERTFQSAQQKLLQRWSGNQKRRFRKRYVYMNGFLFYFCFIQGYIYHVPRVLLFGNDTAT